MMPISSEEYFMGVDWSPKLNWWQKVLRFLRIKRYATDATCFTTWEKHDDGTLECVDITFNK